MGAGLNVAGQFAGSLDNAGETLRLEDAVGEKILEFAYNNTWYPVTDGLGFFLVIVDEHAPWSMWDEKASWRADGDLAVPAPQIGAATVSGSRLAISVASLGGLTYSLEFKGNLPDALWTPLPGSQVGTGGLLIFSDTILASTNRFYRIRMRY